MKDRPSHDRRYAIDATKILGDFVDSAVTFDEGLAETVSWYADHRTWWTRVMTANISTITGGTTHAYFIQLDPWTVMVLVLLVAAAPMRRRMSSSPTCGFRI